MFKPFQELKEKHLIHPLMFIFGGVLEIANHLRGLMLSGMLLTWLILQKVSFEQSSNKPCVCHITKRNLFKEDHRSLLYAVDGPMVETFKFMVEHSEANIINLGEDSSIARENENGPVAQQLITAINNI
jgi:hypothetical protein